MNWGGFNPYIGDPERIKMAKRFFIYLLFPSYYKQGLKRLSQAQEDQGQSIVGK